MSSQKYSRRGDWHCDQCQGINFARNINCKFCKRMRNDKLSSIGDGNCLQGGDRNFKRRTQCRKCDHRKGAAPLHNSKASIYVSGDWICEHCGENNFKRRIACFRCTFDKDHKTDIMYRFTKSFVRRPSDTDKDVDIKKAMFLLKCDEFGELRILEALKTLVEQSSSGAKILIGRDNYGTPIHKVCNKGYTMCIDFMLQELMKVSFIWSSDNLHNHLEDISATLLDNVQVTPEGEIHVLMAKDHSHDVMDNLLLIRGEYENTIFHSACQAKSVSSLKSILKYLSKSLLTPEYLNATNMYGDTPLHVACQTDRVDIVELLLTYPSVIEQSLNFQNDKGNTPLHLADSLKCTQILLSHKQVIKDSVNLKNNAGDTPLHLRWGNIEIAKLLLSDPELIRPSIGTQNNGGYTLLHMRYKSHELFEIVFRDHREIVENMLNIRSNHGDTPLHAACEGMPKMFDFLMNYQSVLERSLNTTDKHGDTPLHNACYSGQTGIVELLLQNTSVILKSLNAQNSGGRTPLMYATKYRNPECVRLLMACPETSVLLKHKKGYTVFSYIRKVSQDSVKEIQRMFEERRNLESNL
jgi:ankyrin repeat protein